MDEKTFISERFASVLEGIPVSLEYGGAATQLNFTVAEETGRHDGHRVLTRSADELRVQLEDAKALLGEAFEELKKVELLDERDQARERAEESAREQADLDSIGLMRARIGAVA